MVRTQCVLCWGPGLIPDRGTRFPPKWINKQTKLNRYPQLGSKIYINTASLFGDYFLLLGILRIQHLFWPLLLMCSLKKSESVIVVLPCSLTDPDASSRKASGYVKHFPHFTLKDIFSISDKLVFCFTPLTTWKELWSLNEVGMTLLFTDWYRRQSGQEFEFLKFKTLVK